MQTLTSVHDKRISFSQPQLTGKTARDCNTERALEMSSYPEPLQENFGSHLFEK